MKILISTILLFFCFYAFTRAQTACITVEVESIQYLEGSVKIGVFDKVHSYRTKSDPFLRGSQPVTDSNATFIFNDVPHGRYAVATYHDENDDDTLNTKKLGIPLEGIGFSGNFNSRLKPPDFMLASFRLKSDTAIIIRMNYNKRK